MMTADAIERLRRKLGLTEKELARLLGLAKTASLGWLSKHEDTLRYAILSYLDEVLSWPAAKRAKKIRAVKRALKQHGTLAALGALLTELAEPIFGGRP